MAEEQRTHVSKAFVGMVASLTVIFTFGVVLIKDYATGIRSNTTHEIFDQETSVVANAAKDSATQHGFRLNKHDDRLNDQSDSIKTIYRKLHIGE